MPTYEDPQASLADVRRTARTDRKLSQAEAAREIGVRRNTYARWEDGARPQARHEAAVADFIGISH